MPSNPEPSADADCPPPPDLPDYPVPPALKQLPTPPSRSELFSLSTSTPLLPSLSTDDPRLNLRRPPPPRPAFIPTPDSPPSFSSIPLPQEPETLAEYRKHEGQVQRLSRLRSLFDSIPAPSASPSSPPATVRSLPPLSPGEAPPSPSSSTVDLPPEEYARARKTYTSELWKQCGASVANSVSPDPSSSSSSFTPTPSPSSFSSGPLSPYSSSPPSPSSSTTGSPTTEAERQTALRAVRWAAFERYADEKEQELWRAFCELDRGGDRRLDVKEVKEACRRAGIELKGDKQVEEFVKAVDRNGDGFISFDEWRDFLLLLPRKTTMKEIWRFYQTHRLDRPSMSRLTQDGDVVVGRGKTGWNKLLGRPGQLAAAERAAATASRKEERERAQALLDGTNLRRQAAREEREQNGERRWVEECARAKARREAEARAKQRGVESQESEGAGGGTTVTSGTLAFEESGVVPSSSTGSSAAAEPEPVPSLEKRVGEEKHAHDGEEGQDEEEEEEYGATHDMFAGAGKFLLAGGMAGAVSRTATAPFDRLKVYLITSPSDPKPPPSASSAAPSSSGAKRAPRRPNAGSLSSAIRAVYAQGGGIKSFWTGNGLNIVKIFPESAIKFLSYESAKRVFAQYWDCVPDQTLISNSSRFVAGGIGGVVSQFCIYPIESLKTRVMSSSSSSSVRGNALILQTARDMWSRGGFRFFFRGLPAGLIGVFPYSAIDMSTFEGIKLAYTKWAGEEPGIAGSLCFGAISGGVGATSVYPLNLVRTRLQAQGTPSHPQTYTGIRDAATKCYLREGWRGFYKGLTPTLVKVVPAVAISYAVYDSSKKMLFAQEEPHSDSDEE